MTAGFRDFEVSSGPGEDGYVFPASLLRAKLDHGETGAEDMDRCIREELDCRERERRAELS